MVLYHGSNLAVRNPQIIHVKYAKDFGTGFYTTEIKEQAERWANRRTQTKGGQPWLSIFKLDDLSGLKVCRFSGISDEWLDFIAACRAGKTHDYDVVSGPMADDEIWTYAEDYLAGSISREAFMALAKFKHPTHQMSFHTEAALGRLAFLGEELVNG